MTSLTTVQKIDGAKPSCNLLPERALDVRSADPWDRVYERSNVTIRRKLRRKGVQSQNLDDAAQDVYLKLFINFHRIRQVDAIDLYLHRIVQDVARSHRRRQIYTADMDVESLGEMEPSTDESEFDELLQSGLDKSELNVLLLLYRHGLTQKMTADRLKLTPRMVRRVRDNAVEKLKLIVKHSNEVK
jgi:DNA-directed RNA polymerase specialized sigma24 family protein